MAEENANQGPMYPMPTGINPIPDPYYANYVEQQPMAMPMQGYQGYAPMPVPSYTPNAYMQDGVAPMGVPMQGQPSGQYMQQRMDARYNSPQVQMAASQPSLQQQGRNVETFTEDIPQDTKPKKKNKTAYERVADGLAKNPYSNKLNQAGPSNASQGGLGYYSSSSIMGDYDKANKINAEAIDREMSIQANAGRKLDQAMNDDIAQRAAIKEEYENDFKKHLGEMDKDYEELKNFSLDSGRLFREMSTGRKLMVGIGLALSTLDQNAMSNTLNVIDKAIERDINAQKADYETKRAGIRDKQNKYKMLREKYGDDLTAHHTLSALYRQKISDELTSKLSLVKGQKQKANLQMAIADQKMKINKHLSELAKAKQTGSSKSLAANMNGPLARVLEGLHPTVQKMAIKEMSKYDESRLGLIELKNFFKPYEDGLDPLKWIQTLPGITKITDAGEEERLAGARVFRFIKMIAQEKVTDADYERFKVFAPSANDTKSQIKLKLEGIKSALRPMLDSSYPILRSHAGLRHPIFDEEEPNVKK